MKSLFEDRRMAVRMPTLLIRYGELGLKSESVRRRFEQALVQDIRRKHLLAKVPCLISSKRGRVYVDSDDWKRSCELLSHTFGVVSFSPVTKASSDLATLEKAAIEYSEPLLSKRATFAVRTRRTGTHPYTSQTLAARLGEVLLEKFADRGIRVALDDPDVELFVEVREREAALYSTVLPGPGGMPKGTQGRLLSVVDSADGVASSWLLMKRGCSVIVTGPDRRLVEPLLRWDPDLRFAERDGDLVSQARTSDCIGLTLQLMLEDLTEGRSLKGDLPVFYPLVGMTREEVDRLLGRISA